MILVHILGRGHFIYDARPAADLDRSTENSITDTLFSPKPWIQDLGFKYQPAVSHAQMRRSKAPKDPNTTAVWCLQIASHLTYFEQASVPSYSYPVIVLPYHRLYQTIPAMFAKSAQMQSILTACLPLVAAALHGTRHVPQFDRHGQETTDCQIRCPKSAHPSKVILPALTQAKNTTTGEWENTLECWSIDTVDPDLTDIDIDNAIRLHWEGGFDKAYQYIFHGDSYMPAHPAPEPSLILMSAGIDLRVPSGKCLRVGAGDVFFSVGTLGKQTAWWSEGTLVSDFYFKDGKIPHHEVVEEIDAGNDAVGEGDNTFHSDL
ncbi:uncharacterized protein PODANS_4_200 [Podospora anserina S mat+]|uniref:Podospora anserina S mat+ genomic DNA chromosome 4, supercontig 1 n=1 Tax=Podospora anserina (strain S / ATCC MYA-4624 / DSM 980 / FGSC 10383) TaxID=515849 RepID=B2AD62_PODAN|nr:uncharacterized protein PODANS_4_200 [Podospora anserina S mat+]CAP61377.1 unnamed protein product [Podospora anserina S mat+]